MTSSNITKSETEVTKEILHDLINPLTSISLLLNSNKVKDPYIKKSKDKIESITKTLSILLGDSKNKIITCEDLHSITESLRSKATRTDVSFVFIHQENIKLIIDPLPFYKVFLNLISNSIDSYTTERKRKVIITDRITNNKVVISIEDFGSGIKNSLKYGSSQKEYGHGYGMSIINENVKKLSGEIEIINKNNGTLINVYLPKSIVV